MEKAISSDRSGIFHYIMSRGYLIEYRNSKEVEGVGPLSFLEIDQDTKRVVQNIAEKRSDKERAKIWLLLDVALLMLFTREKRHYEQQQVILDLHFYTLHKALFRTRYLTVLADRVARLPRKPMLNIRFVPPSISVERLSDPLRYLLQINPEYSVQVTPELLKKTDLSGLVAKNIVLTLPDLAHMNQMEDRDTYSTHLAKLTASGKQFIIRNITETASVAAPAMEPVAEPVAKPEIEPVAEPAEKPASETDQDYYYL